MRVTPSIPSSSSVIEGVHGQTNQPLAIPQETKQQDHTKVDLNKIIDKLQERLSNSQTHIKVQMHKGTNTIMVRIIDNETNEVLKEIPSEKMLDMTFESWERLGLFVDERM